MTYNISIYHLCFKDPMPPCCKKHFNIDGLDIDVALEVSQLHTV